MSWELTLIAIARSSLLARSRAFAWCLVPGQDRLGILLYRFRDRTYTTFYVWNLNPEIPPIPVIENASYRFAPVLLERDQILAVTDHEAPNSRIVELRRDKDQFQSSWM